MGTSVENVEIELEELISEINDYNGRVGRTLMNYYLLIHQIAPLIIYEQDKKLYYECLEKIDKDSDLEPLKKFIEYEQEKTWTRKDNMKTKLNNFI